MKPVSISILLANMFLAGAALSAPAGVLLFAQEGTQIVDASGAARPARRGDTLQTGERLRTPTGGILQLRLPDGSLVGMRPGSELALDLPTGTGSREQLLSLTQGTARVIGAELMDASKSSSLLFQSGLATLKLRGADVETAVLKPDTTRTSLVTTPGSYSRLIIGAATIGNGALETPLAPRQISFVGTINVAPTVVTSVSPTLFTATGASLLTAPVDTAKTTAPTTTTPPPPTSGDRLAPTQTTSTLVSLPAGSTTTLLAPPTNTGTLAPVKPSTQIATATPAPTPVNPTPLAPVTVSPVLVKPVLATPIVVSPPPPTKLPVLSCKVLRTC